MSKYYLFLLLFCFPLLLTAQIRLPRLVGDHMILQRDQPIPIYGWAGSRANVTVTFAGKEYDSKAGRDGKWTLRLPAMKAGGPYTMTISSKKDRRTINDILIGDVWVASGQSNMEWQLSVVNNAETEILGATDAQIRQFKVPHSASYLPQDTLVGGEWVVLSPETAPDFTAVGYFFARNLRAEAGVPIGLINTSWGGSCIEPWMDAATLGFSDSGQMAHTMQQKEIAEREQLLAGIKEKMGGEIPKEDRGMANGKPQWAAQEYNDSDWKTMQLPGLWEGQGWQDLDGVVWFRKTVDLNAGQAAGKAAVGLGMIDDSDEVWINDQKVGGLTASYNVLREYQIPAGVLQAGKNVITIRVVDTGGGGGVHGDPASLFLETPAGRLSLAGDWKYKVGQVNVQMGSAADNQKPTKLYNYMIRPIQWYPVKGAIWYQGESNANSMEEAKDYARLFKQMITQWRKQWGVGDFPFLYVQLANFMETVKEPGESNWALLRESQSAALELPNTAQAVIIDIGEANDIHPRNKQDVGYRLALAARKLVYGETDLLYSGPVYKSMKQEGNKIRLQFEHTGEGLVATRDRYGYLKEFAIAGKDKKWHWAKASIEGDEVVVWSEAVPEPVAVRYAWANNPAEANLYNSAGLPASPFRTDGW